MMTPATSRAPHAQVAIVGDGVGALITWGVLRAAGLAATDMVVFGDAPAPLARLERCATAIEQRRMRSEGQGHLRPLDTPRLAWVELWRRRTLWPLWLALWQRYTPPLDLLLDDTRAWAEQSGFWQQRVPTRIAAVERSALNRFVLRDQQQELVGSARHVVLALGYPGLAWPAALCAWRQHPCVQHAYAEHQFSAADHVVVIGGGMAAAHLWSAALQRGAQVTALHRHPLRRQFLNAPRCTFSAVGLDAYQQLEPAQRRQFFANLGAASFPWRLSWEWQRWQAQRSGRFQSRTDRVVALAEPSPGHLCLSLASGATLAATKVICATGFEQNMLRHTLIAGLVERYGVPQRDGRLLVADDCTLPQLSQPASICGAVGVLSRWALPIADTFMGMKYAARRLQPLLMQTQAG